MVGRLLTFWGPAYFQVRTVSFREGISPFCTGPGKPTIKVPKRTARKTHRETAEVKSFMTRASQSVESLELRVDEVGSKAHSLVMDLGVLLWVHGWSCGMDRYI